LFFNFTEYQNFADSFAGVEINDVDMTWELAQAMKEDAENMVGGPTDPVQILNVGSPDQPSPQEQNASIQINNYVLVIVAVVVVVVVILGTLLVLRKRKQRLTP
jgi:hypothetical protein